MKRKEEWKDFDALADTRPGYQAWLYCKDPGERALRRELIEKMIQLSKYHSIARKMPMPTQICDELLDRASLHIDQNVLFHEFVEILFENFLRQGSDENMNLLFAFLEKYISLAEAECRWFQT